MSFIDFNLLICRYAFAAFATEEIAKKAYDSAHGKTLAGNKIIVVFARARKEKKPPKNKVEKGRFWKYMYIVAY